MRVKACVVIGEQTMKIIAIRKKPLLKKKKAAAQLKVVGKRDENDTENTKRIGM